MYLLILYNETITRFINAPTSIKLRATFSGVSDFADISDPPLTLHTCSSEVVSRDAVSATGAIKSESGIALFGRLSNAYDPKFFRMLLEAKNGEVAVAVPVAFLSYPGQNLFAPIVKDGEMLGFAGAARESLTLSGNLIFQQLNDRLFSSRPPPLYRVTHHDVQNLPLTSKQKFCFGLAWTGLAWPGQSKAELLFQSQREVLHNVMCHPVQCPISFSLTNRSGTPRLLPEITFTPMGRPRSEVQCRYRGQIWRGDHDLPHGHALCPN